MLDNSNLIIRDFQNSDLRPVATILSEAFRDDILKIIHLPNDKIVDFLIDSGEVYPFPFSGYIVAENNEGIIGVMMLKWLKQKRPKVRFPLLKTLKYGWLVTIKLLVERFLFPERPTKDACHIAELAVKPTVEGRGVGTRLLNYGKELALAMGLHKYTLNVDADYERALKLYKKLGFKVVKKYKHPLASWFLGVRGWYFMRYDIGVLANQHK